MENSEEKLQEIDRILSTIPTSEPRQFKRELLRVKSRIEGTTKEQKKNMENNFATVKRSAWNKPLKVVRHEQDEASTATANTKDMEVNALEEKMQVIDQKVHNINEARHHKLIEFNAQINSLKQEVQNWKQKSLKNGNELQQIDTQYSKTINGHAEMHARMTAIEAKATEVVKNAKEVEQKVDEIKENLPEQVKIQTNEIIREQELVSKTEIEMRQEIIMMKELEKQIQK